MLNLSGQNLDQFQDQRKVHVAPNYILMPPQHRIRCLRKFADAGLITPTELLEVMQPTLRLKLLPFIFLYR
jgi:hypothetical protein